MLTNLLKMLIFHWLPLGIGAVGPRLHPVSAVASLDEG